MPKTGTASLPLHYGKAPAWLFKRMSALAREITKAIVCEFGQKVFLEKLSDPYWFQALGCVLGFDWHSSGITTTVTGALKDGLKGMEGELGIFIAGGKGGTSRKTPEQIERYGEKYMINPIPLVYASKMSAKVDNTAIQDGYQLYHHVFVFNSNGSWSVIQQGLNEGNKMARRYHWLGDDVKDFVVEPHSAICCDRRNTSLNMVDSKSEGARKMSAVIASEKPEKLVKDIDRFRNLELTKRHNVMLSDIDPKRLYRIFTSTYERQPDSFETLLSIKGVGPKTIRALSLVSDIIYNKPPSFRDPARFSFAHGGKDGTPYPVDRNTYDKTIDIMKKAVQSAKVGNREKIEAVRRLMSYFGV